MARTKLNRQALGGRALMTLLLAVLPATACDSYEPVPASSCDQVVGHAKEVLGEQAESWSKMNARCQAANDQQRGCILVADSAADVLRCSM